jgi:hypothetical protein
VPPGPARSIRASGAGAVALAALLIVYSQVRYPANLTHPGYLVPYLVILAALGGLAVVVGRGRLTLGAAVPFGLGAVPAWLTMFSDWPVLGVAGAVMVITLLITAGLVAPPGFAAGLRAGATAGALAGVMLLLVNLGEGLATMAWLVHDPTYLGEYARTGQSDPAAYIVGERIAGGAYTMPAVFVLGCLAGVVTGTARRLAIRATPTG